MQTITYKIDTDLMTVLRWTDGKRDSYTDLNARGKLITTEEDLSEFLTELDYVGAFDGLPEGALTVLTDEGIVTVREVTADDVFTAKITGIGSESCVPDNAGAVDATIFLAGEEIGAVTLLPSEDHGELDKWGDSLDHWADWALIKWLEDLYEGRHGLDRSDVIGQIIHAVREAV